MAYKKQQRGGGGQVDWFPVSPITSVVGVVNDGAQATIVDAALVNPVTSQNFDAGTLVGIRLWTTAAYGAACVNPAGTQLVIMILRNGAAVPAVLTDAQLKQAERFIWAQKLMVAQAGTAQTLAEASMELHSSRKFEPGDRLVMVVVNRTGTNWAATARFNTLVDAYVREG